MQKAHIEAARIAKARRMDGRRRTPDNSYYDYPGPVRGDMIPAGPEDMADTASFPDIQADMMDMARHQEKASSSSRRQVEAAKRCQL